MAKKDNTNLRCSYISMLLRWLGPGAYATDLDCLTHTGGIVSDFNGEPWLLRQRVNGKHLPTGLIEFKRNHGGGASKEKHLTQLEVLSGLYNERGEQLPCFFVRYEFEEQIFTKHVTEYDYSELVHLGRPHFFVEACNDAAVRINRTAEPVACDYIGLGYLLAEISQCVEAQTRHVHSEIRPALSRLKAPALNLLDGARANSALQASSSCHAR